MADINAVATAFTDFYYQTFDTNRANLAALYRPESTLSFEGQQHIGAEAITKKLVELPFHRIKHQISTADAQICIPGQGNIMVLVTGGLLVDEEQNPQMFTQAFHLVPAENGSYWVFNDVFRFNYI